MKDKLLIAGFTYKAFRGPKHSRQPEVDGHMFSFLWERRNGDMPVSLEIIQLKVLEIGSC
jgi:hypothetical protein